MLNKRSFIYASKVWLSSWLLTPPLIMSISIIYDIFLGKFSLNSIVSDNNILSLSMFEITMIIYFYSFFCSIPFWVAFWPSVHIIDRFNLSETSKKLIATVIATLFLCLLFHIVDAMTFISMHALPYIITVSCGIWYHKIHPAEKVKTQDINIDDHLII